MLALRLLSEGGQGPDASLMFVFLIMIAFFFLMIAVGWMTSTVKQDQAEVEHEAKRSMKKNAEGGHKSKQ